MLVFGAGTDYALLTVSRYREELHYYERPVDALKAAWRGTVEPILASGGTASLGLLMLLFSELNSNKSTGPVAAVGIASALVVMLTLAARAAAGAVGGAAARRLPRRGHPRHRARADLRDPAGCRSPSSGECSRC